MWVVSDAVSNSLQIVGTYCQVHEARTGYVTAAEAVVAQDGLQDLLGRGLKTRILANRPQELKFSVLRKHFLDMRVAVCRPYCSEESNGGPF